MLFHRALPDEDPKTWIIHAPGVVGATLAVATRPGDLRGCRDARMNRRVVMAFRRDTMANRHDLFVGYARCVGHKMPARGILWQGDRKGRPYGVYSPSGCFLHEKLHTLVVSIQWDCWQDSR